MSTTNFNTANTEGIDFNQTYTAYDQTAALSSSNDPSIPAPPFKAGTTVKGSGDSDFVFVKATAAVTAGDTVTISSAYTAAGATSTTGLFGNLLGVAVVSIASGAYGWIQRAGFVTGGITSTANSQPNVQMYTTATGGQVTSTLATSTNKAIVGLNIITTATTSTAPTVGWLNYPTVGVSS